VVATRYFELVLEKFDELGESGAERYVISMSVK
jgi:hypothetical protein